MKITTSKIDDFIRNLQDTGVFRSTVYYENSSRHLNGKTKRDATSFEVFYQASAVLEFEDGQALLVCGIECGIDRTTGDGGLEGSNERQRIHERLSEYCQSVGLKLMPGVLDQ